MVGRERGGLRVGRCRAGGIPSTCVGGDERWKKGAFSCGLLIPIPISVDMGSAPWMTSASATSRRNAEGNRATHPQPISGHAFRSSFA